MHFQLKKKPQGRMKDYFDDSEEEGEGESTLSGAALQEGEEVDPLDAFMCENSEQLKTEQLRPSSSSPSLPEIVSGQYEDEEDEEDRGRARKIGAPSVEEYDSDGVPLGTKKGGSEKLDALPPLDHSQIVYQPFRKALSPPDSAPSPAEQEEAQRLRAELNIHVSGAPSSSLPAPCTSFSALARLGLPPPLLADIARLGFEAPTPIQAQALPVVLAGRDLIGLAKTGSGKTFSFLWPLLAHIADQPNMRSGEGPIVLILTPTRELAEQICRHAQKFGKLFNIRACAVFGGEGKWQMVKALKEAPEIVVATPGRLMELLGAGATNMRRCTLAVIDECDRMFELGFEYQVKSILQHIRPDRQTLMFSATMKSRVEGFAREALRDPVRIQVGNSDESNPDIQQVIEVLPEQGHKWPWLMCRLQSCLSSGLVLIFVNSKADTEDVASRLQQHFRDLRGHQLQVGGAEGGVEVCCLHGGKQQGERSEIIRRFKSGACQVLVATDVASRGLDIKNIRTVINYDGAKSRDSHVHRIGRTGRMGLEGVVPGVAYTLLVRGDKERSKEGGGGDAPSFAYTDATLAMDLVHMLRKQEAARSQLQGVEGGVSSVTPELLKLAQTDPRWRQSQSRQQQFWGGRGGKAAGIGHGQQAMTSAQLSSSCRGGAGGLTSTNAGALQAMQKLMGTGGGQRTGPPLQQPLQQHMQANPYMEGRGCGRGAHMTQPAWAATSPAPSTDTATLATTSSTSVTQATHSTSSDWPSLTTQRKRKSRFSALFNGDNTDNADDSHGGVIRAATSNSTQAMQQQQQQQQHIAHSSSSAHAPVLKGFVRAESTGSNGSGSNSVTSSGPMRKTSRWS